MAGHAPELPTVRDLLLARADEDRPAVRSAAGEVTYHEYVGGCARWARVLLDRRHGHEDDGPFHVGVLLDNGLEYASALGAAALVGATVVGLNPTRQGPELARDIAHTHCQVVLTEAVYREALTKAGTTVPQHQVDGRAWLDAVAAHDPVPPPTPIDPLAPYLLLFTSGTTGDPKAAICSQLRVARIGRILADTYELGPDDVCYQVMPMFHSNALMAGWAPCLAAGATAAFRRRFSASGFLSDVRRFGATYFNYVGKPLTYILATPERPDDADNPLRVVFGNEGAAHDLERFEQRFGVRVQDSYGSTEGGVSISRTADTPSAALGRGDASVAILDADTGRPCPPGRFDEAGRLQNGEEAIGEIVSLAAAPTFEGYWNNPAADDERTHGGIYWSGDLGYRDATGLIYFAGRNYDWLRVDGENFAAGPVERVLVRHPDIDLAFVYAVPNADVGDDVMAAVVHRPGAAFDPDGFAAFLTAQPDLGGKWAPRYLRWGDSLPQTATNKILKRQLRAERWEVTAEIWLREGARYRRLDPADVAAIGRRFAERDRLEILDRT